MPIPLIAAKAAMGAADTASKGLKNDIAILRGQFYRPGLKPVQVEHTTKAGKVKTKTEWIQDWKPIDYELHVNPVGLAVGGAVVVVGAAAAAILAAVAWHGINIPTMFGQVEVFRGVKDTTMGDDLNKRYEGYKVNKAEKAKEKETAKNEETKLIPAFTSAGFAQLIGK